MEYNQQFKYEIEANSISIKIVMSRRITEIIIPDAIDGIPVTEIGEGAFKKCKLLTKAVIPDSIMKIGDNAFSECDILENVKLPPNLKKINAGAFSNCRKLKNITLPDSIEEIGNSAFASCVNLESITFSDKISNVMERAFADCVRLSEVIILSENIRFGFRVFYHCKNLNALTLRYDYTKFDISSQKELEAVDEIKIRILRDDGAFDDVKVFVPTDSSANDNTDSIHKQYVELFKSGFTWNAYDDAYSALTDIEKMIDVAAYRMICKIGLSSEMEKSYCSLLKKHSKTAIIQFIEYDDDAGLEVMANIGSITRFNIRKYIKISQKEDSPKCEEFLLNYKKLH